MDERALLSQPHLLQTSLQVVIAARVLASRVRGIFDLGKRIAVGTLGLLSRQLGSGFSLLHAIHVASTMPPIGSSIQDAKGRGQDDQRQKEHCGEIGNNFFQ